MVAMMCNSMRSFAKYAEYVNRLRTINTLYFKKFFTYPEIKKINIFLNLLTNTYFNAKILS